MKGKATNMVATRHSSPLVSWFLIILFGFTALIYLAAAAQPAVNVGAISHAVERHGTDAEVIRAACQNGGFYKSFLAPDGKQIQTCFVRQTVKDRSGKTITTNRVGFRVSVKIDGKWDELTAYFRDCLQGQGSCGIEQWAKDFGWKNIK